MDRFLDHSGSEDENMSDLGSDEEFFAAPAASESEDEMNVPSKSKKKVFDAFGGKDDDESEGSDEDENDMKSNNIPKKSSKETEEEDNINELYRKSKLLKIKNKKPKGKTGVVYLSKIPPYMKPTKMRQILSRFGEVDRLFLKRESTQKYQQRVKQGGNKKNMYEEGWAEFIRKKDAKLCADTLNCNILGGKKSSFYYDDIMNVKYLSGFKWSDLTEQISKENEARQSKLQMEISQARKLNKTFIANVQKSKMIENMKSKKKDHEDDEKIRRTFEQRKITTTRADGPSKYKNPRDVLPESVLSNVF
jgi:ESF2/ABP1 family protein